MTEDASRAVATRIFGIVQGVGFRYSAFTQASRLGLSGFVRNMTDGSVELVALGDPEKIDTLISWIKKGGPPGAFVRKVDINPIPCDKSIKGFSIEY